MAQQKADNAVTNASENGEQPVNVIGNFATVEDFTKHGFSEVINATKSVNAFPQGSARDLYCSYPTFGRIVDERSHRILGLVSKVLKWQNVKGNIQRRQHDEQFEMLLECNDAMLERVSSNLDELAGIKKNHETIIIESKLNATTGSTTEIGRGAGSWNVKKQDGSPKVTNARLITAKNIIRPQTNFAVPVDNSSMTPFIPRIKEKPNSLKPLAVLPEYDEDGSVASYLHPYEFELLKFEVPAEQLKRTTPQMPIDLSATPRVYVDTVPKLKTAIKELRAFKTIAVDVEHHSYRTFLGLTCLVQISSPEKDYIFDALELREDMHLFNIIFTDPTVVKIFHGADSDVEWLQRDLSLYIVNMFDTHQAAKSLNFARLSLAYILKHYCNMEIDKSFQLADWRMRPLPEQLLEYARKDTHYLIYVYQRMTNDLLDTGNQSNKLLQTIYQRCTDMCKRRYKKPIITANTHLELCRKMKRMFDNRQLYALEKICQWRDNIARIEDESNGYVLPNHMMLQIAESLPREMQGILACCNPIPPLVRQHLHALHQIILYAREQPLVKPILENADIFRDVATQRKDYNEKLHCVFDTTHDEEFRDDLPTLFRFDNELPIVQNESIVRDTICAPKLTYFGKQHGMRRFSKLDFHRLLVPYQRFLAYLPVAEQEKAEEAARLEALTKRRRLCPSDAVAVKTEESQEQAKQERFAGELYAVPIKEMLKRKHQTENKSATEAEAPNAKRFKKDTAIESQKSKRKDDQPSAKTSGDIVYDITGDDSDDDAPMEMSSKSQPAPVPQSSKAQRKRNFKNNHLKRLKTHQGSNNAVGFNSPSGSTNHGGKPRNFDYKNVDFRKFGGGARRVQGSEIKAQIHGKGKTNSNSKKFNKLFTFSNVKGHKK